MIPSYSENDPKGWCGDPRRGAAMGRPTVAGDSSYSGRVYLRRVYLDQGGYDKNGTYFGHADPLYWCVSEDGTIDRMLRGHDRNDARSQVLEWYPKARVRK